MLHCAALRQAVWDEVSVHFASIVTFGDHCIGF